MPSSGSQVVLCDVPIRYDTYAGCSHGCAYCFTSRKVDIAKIKPGESAASLKSWIEGKRRKDVAWCDWNIPLHWGGMSDPFQPVERVEKRSLEALEIFAKTKYPFIVSTKNKMIAEEPYLSLIKECDCVVQFSACSPLFDKIERGASTYSERIAAARTIAKYKRVNIRIQPYVPAIFRDVLKALPVLAEAGVHGVILEGMKYQQNKVPGLISAGKDFIYPLETLLPQFEAIKRAAHKWGLKFYCGENRLRALSDELCCCGVEGLGWKVHEANANHYLFDPNGFSYTEKEMEAGTASCFLAIHQDTVSQKKYGTISFAEAMNEHIRNPYMYVSHRGGQFTEQEESELREVLRAALKASGRKAKDVDRLLGTNGMAGHYFGSSQWCFPTAEAYEKMRTILPLPTAAELFARFGITGMKPTIYGALNKNKEE